MAQADVQKVVEIVFGGIDKVSSVAGSVGTSLEKVGGGISNLTAPFASLANNILMVEGAVTALAVGGMTYAVMKAIDFESATADLNKVLGEEEDRLGEAQAKALELSSAYGIGSSAALQSMANFKQAGFNLTESMELTKASLDLVIAGDLEASQASEILVSTLKGFKAPATEAATLVDILNEVSNNYATNVLELGSGMARLSPIANQMGFTFAETAGLLTPIIEVFRSGDEAANALKAGLLKLIDDSKPVEDALARIGVSQRDANGQFKSGKEILEEVVTAFQYVDTNEKMYLSTQLVGIHQAARMTEVFNGMGKSAEIAATALRGVGTSAEKEVATRLATAEIAVKRFRYGFENLAIEVGKEFLAATNDIIVGGTEIEETLRGLVKEGTFEPLFAKVQEYGAEFEALLSGIAEALPGAFKQVDYSGLMEAMDMVKQAVIDTFKSIFGDLDLTKLDDLAQAIQKVVDVIRVLTASTAGIITGLNDFIKGMGWGIDKITEMDNATVKTQSTMLGWATALHDISGVVSGIGTALNVLAGVSLVNTVSSILKTVTAVEGATLAFTALRTALAFLTGPAGLLIAVGTGVVALGGYLATHTDTVDKFLLKVGNLVSNLFSVKEANAAVNESWGLSDAQVNQLQTEIGELNKELEVNFGILRGTPEQMKALDEASVRVYEEMKKVAASMNLPKVDVQVNTEQIINAGQTLEEKVPSKKTVDVETKIEIEKIKADADVLKEALNIKGKIEIANIEAATERLKMSFTSLDSGIKSTENTLLGFWDVLSGGGLDIGQTMMMERYLDDENRRREEQFDLQKKLVEQQIELGKIKLEQLESGDALIKIDGSGLAPHIEAIMWEILEAIQVRANATGAEFLLGI